ncbi:DNA polymerase I [Candidatus Kuenenbacteria bacterium CG11_big_fil_rev_8_21_14_0_20_37_9]|nr:MAG: DNA polymerase I [Candidatus Kuenenbacteria bacterium CG11_big_fil_rev_8_21_14_0_20_37_9]
MKKSKFAIIDANAIIHRAFHALPPLQNKDGVLVNAVYGFANILLKILQDIKPDYIAVCFDVAKKTFRNEIYADYKAQREKGPQELYNQMNFVRQLVRAFNMRIFEQAGYEADDLIGTLAKKIKNIESLIVTGDMDALQLIDENTKVYTLRKGIADTVIYDKQGVIEKYGFRADQVVDYKALRGDQSDNIPGVNGVGEKTATELIKTFGSLEELYKFIDRIKMLKDEELKNLLDKKNIKKGIFEKLKNGKEQAFLSKKLATIVKNVKIDFKLEQCKVQPFDAEKVIDLFQRWNFKSLIARIPHAEKTITKGQPSLFDKHQNQLEDFAIRPGYVLINNENKFNNFIEKLTKQKEFAIDTETDGLDPFKDKLIGMSFSWKTGEAYYLPIKIQGAVNKKQKAYNFQRQMPQLKKILADKNIKKIGHNIKFDLEVLGEADFELNGVEFDTMLASYLLNPGSRQHKLDTVVFIEFKYEMTPITALIGKGKTQTSLNKVDIKRVADYAAEDADYTWRMYQVLKKLLEKNHLLELMEKIENPLINVLARMEKNGVAIDEKFLQAMSKELGDEIKKTEKKVFAIAGREFNLRSPLQLKKILFDKLNIPTNGLGRTKSGVSTAVGELEKLKGTHPIVDLIENHRELSKLKSTYTDSLPKLVNPCDGRIHTSYNQTITATGRLSSSDPNLQNIPVRTELGKKIRQAFVAPLGYKIVAIDYSQIELRLAAAMSGDKIMTESFSKGEDFHARTAAEVFNVNIDKVTGAMRRKAKEVNFGILYGLGARGLAQRIGSTYDDALAFIEKYFEAYHELKEYMEETIVLAHDMEYVETLFGRKRFLPGINAEHQGMRAQAERMAINHPLQGTAADVMKMAMIEVDKLINEKYKNGEVKMIMQVHDELIFEIKDNLAEKIAGEIQTEMETVHKFEIPILAEISIGKNWGECK